MQIEQALYGECRGGHALLASSGDEAVTTGIVQRLDLPDTAPPGVDWSPFLRGFPYGDRYVLSRTFHDTGASRGGMVFSHALVAPVDEIAETRDLRPLLKLLATSDRQRPDVTTVQHVSTDTDTQIPQATDLIHTAEALGASGELPVVRLGHVGFDDLVVALWAHLLPEIRRGFAFRLSFDPRDLVETPMPALVCTPSGMAARWTGYPVIRSAARREPGSLAAAALCGHGKAAPLIEFMQEMGVKPTRLSDLRLVEQAHRLDIAQPTLERCVGVMRVLQELSPDSDAGEGGKDVVVRRLCDLLSESSAEEILRLRNLKLSAFRSGNRVWNALKRWVVGNNFPQNQDVKMLSVLKDGTADTNAVEEWRKAVLNGFAVAAGVCKPSFAKAFWRWLQIGPETVGTLFHYVPREARVENGLVATVPRSLDEEAAETLARPALSRGWFRLHGAVVSASYTPSDAVRRQVAVDTDPSFFEGLRSAIRHAKARELMECALQIEDTRMPLLAAEAVANDPRLLAGVDLTAIKVQVIWREALFINPKCWQGPNDPTNALYSILDGLLDGAETDLTLLEGLSETPVADLVSYRRRHKVWSRIGGSANFNFLVATVNGWLREAANVGIPFVPEHELQAAILESDELGRTLNELIPSGIGNLIRIIATLKRYDEQRFVRLMEKLMSRTTLLAISDAEGIGRLVLERRWMDVTGTLVEEFRSGRLDVEPALRECYDMLGFWERIMLQVAPISEWEIWESFQELATELYPGGPNEDGLWERAGGDDADLLIGENGRTRWRKAVRKVRNGKGPTPSALLSEMKKDFPNNKRIFYLARNRIFSSGVPDGVGSK